MIGRSGVATNKQDADHDLKVLGITMMAFILASQEAPF